MRSFVMTFFVGLLLVPPSVVCAGAENPLSGQNVSSLTQAIDYADQGFAKKPIFKGEGYVVLLFAFKKGQELKAHTIPISAMVQVLEGAAIVVIDGKEYTVKTGEMITLPKNLSHALIAKEDFKMLLVK